MQDSDIKELFSAMKMLKDKLDHIEKTEQGYLARIEELEKQIKKLQKAGNASQQFLKGSDVNIAKIDPYSKSNFIDKGDYIELVTPLVVVDENCKRSYIKAIQKDWKKGMNFDSAARYAQNLRLGGLNDWHVPTKDELYEIYKIRNVCGIKKFKDHADYSDNCFWSSSPYDAKDDYVWYVNFHNGELDRSVDVDEYNVLCVAGTALKGTDVNIANPKGKDPYSRSNFKDIGGFVELVTPLAIVDENCKKRYICAIQNNCLKSMDFDSAMKYAKTLRLGGFSDWCVPTKEELYEIYKISNLCGMRQSDESANWGGTREYWSSSTEVDNSNEACCSVDFRYGGFHSTMKQSEFPYVFCVRYL